ncbi:ABC transporter ATP-binding protein [Microaerobacter geothermalis]|uniref:ABC transporter ATP-binding protein n=1 Tax=Microaerobacter geothermalis TaxID=674972 RepID=UPI002E307CB2|nr:ABC transporter ATP-binding protein [Microaerobacter geothermalis]
MALLEAIDIRKTYKDGDGEVIALHDVSLSIDFGDFAAVMGPSGSGKSTLLTILGVLNPPTSGKLMIDDIDVYRLPIERQADFRRTYIGFVFQQLQLIPYLTALENVMLPLAISNYSKHQQREMAEVVLRKVGLGNKINRLPNQLSGGEQERVAIARAIVNQPPIVMADEPTGSLDSKTSVEIMELFQSLNQEGLTIIMVTHNPENLAYVKRTIRVKDGMLESDG